MLDAYSGGRFTVWERQGFLEVSDGDVIDYEPIHEEIDRARKAYRLQELALDPWNSAQTIAWAERENITAVHVGQTFAKLSGPTKEFLRLVRTGRLRHGGHPLARYNVDGFELKQDHRENVMPVKPNRDKSGKRIDGIVAAILALSGYVQRGQHRRRSAYEDRGLDVV